MRDIIWTLIIVWLIYKVIDIFRNSSAKRSSDQQEQKYQRPNTSNHPHSPPEKDLKNAVRKHLNNEGEYVDFEEVK